MTPSIDIYQENDGGQEIQASPPLYLSLKDIEKVHQTLFDAFEAKKRLAALRS
ncbi:hypothetical protein HJ013_24400 [Vibrio parahaemolyticus]|nr:hypothetical protein [Vibrio parahaemolyticus]